MGQIESVPNRSQDTYHSPWRMDRSIAGTFPNFAAECGIRLGASTLLVGIVKDWNVESNNRGRKLFVSNRRNSPVQCRHHSAKTLRNANRMFSRNEVQTMATGAFTKREAANGQCIRQEKSQNPSLMFSKGGHSHLVSFMHQHSLISHRVLSEQEVRPRANRVQSRRGANRAFNKHSEGQRVSGGKFRECKSGAQQSGKSY